MKDVNQLALLELIKGSLFGSDINIPEDIDWDKVLEEATAHTVVPIAAAAVPPNIAPKWQEAAAQNTAHYIRMLFEQTHLVKLFSDNNIPFVIIKGSAAAIYYPKPQLRTMGDIDFIVEPQCFDTALEILMQNNYKFEHKYDDDREYTFSKGGIILELHHRYSDIEFDIEQILTDGIKNAVTHEINGHRFPTLPDYQNGLVLLDHIRHHLHYGLGIRQIIDWAMFASNMLTDNKYNDCFLPLLKTTRLETFCKTVTKMCKLYLGVPGNLSWCDSADEDLAEQFLDTVLLSGNFGRKKPHVYRPMAELTLDIRKKRFFKVLQTAGVENFAICKKNRFFRCFAWLFQIFRFIKRGTISLLRGEKLIGDISTGNEKADFYNRLGI